MFMRTPNIVRNHPNLARGVAAGTIASLALMAAGCKSSESVQPGPTSSHGADFCASGPTPDNPTVTIPIDPTKPINWSYIKKEVTELGAPGEVVSVGVGYVNTSDKTAAAQKAAQIDQQAHSELGVPADAHGDEAYEAASNNVGTIWVGDANVLNWAVDNGC